MQKELQQITLRIPRQAVFVIEGRREKAESFSSAASRILAKAVDVPFQPPVHGGLRVPIKSSKKK